MHGQFFGFDEFFGHMIALGGMMEYTVQYSRRKTLLLQVQKDGKLLVRAPLFTPSARIKAFVEEKKRWIQKARQKVLARPQMPDDQETVLALTEKAKTLILPKVAFYSLRMGLHPSSVKISHAKTRFGSCTSKGVLRFSCYLMLYPEEAVDYVVVHELAHLKYMNHKKEFYDLVCAYMPDYKKRRALLKP